MQVRPLRALIVLLAVGCLASCGLLGSSVEDTATGYYNYMLGLSPQQKYTEFLSPAYRSAMPRASLEKIDAFRSRHNKVNSRAVPIKTKQVAVVREGKFALTSVRAQPGQAGSNFQATKWVNDGRWYIYIGTEAEVKRYGSFPAQLRPPLPGPARPPGKRDVDAPQ